MVAFNIQMHLSLCVVFISCVSAFEKHWLSAISLEDPSNWDPPRLPCPDDKIVLKSAVVYIENNITVESINLHTNGAITFSPNTVLTFQEKSQRKKREVSRCSGSGGMALFIGQQKKPWLNPMNWDIYTNGKKDEYLTKAVPYVERVPCIDDTVSFPKGNAFEINVEGKIAIKGIILNEQVITNDTILQTYLTYEGKSQFHFPNAGSSLKLNSKNTCGNSGCQCGNDILIKKICNNFKCPETCVKKVKPHADCCYHCGALIDIKYDHNFNLNRCWKDLRLHLRKSNFSGVWLYMSVTESKNTKIQIVITEDSDGSNAEAAADSIQDYVKNSTSNMCDGIISSKTIFYKEEVSTTTIVLAVVLTIIFVALIIIAAYYFHKKRNFEIKKQRFQNEDVSHYPGADDMEMTTDFTIPDLFPGANAFDNPSYNLPHVQDDDDGEGKDDMASPEYTIPVNYFPKKSIEETDIPRYVGIDDIEVDGGNVNPLYEGIHENLTPDASEVDLDSTDETDSIRKLQLKLKDLSDSEGDGVENEIDAPVEEIEETESYYDVVVKPKKAENELDAPVEEIKETEPEYGVVVKPKKAENELDAPVEDTDETDSIRKLQLKLKDLSDSEGDGVENEIDAPVEEIEETESYYDVVVKPKKAENELDAPVEEIEETEPEYAVLEKPKEADN